MNRIPIRRERDPAGPAPGTESRIDPWCWMVQAAMAVYLFPVLLLVLLFGGGTMMLGSVARGLRRIGIVPDGPASAVVTTAREKGWAASAPHHHRVPRAGVKNRSA